MVSAYVLVSVEAGKNQDVVAALRQVAGVTPTHTCWGQPDIFAYVEVGDDSAMADTVLVTVQAIPGVRTTETPVVAPV
jgi:DNA-binding Lrp family transcriptional regulator